MAFEKKLTLTRTTWERRSCSACGAGSYNYETKEDTGLQIFELRIGCMVNAICPSCLRELIGAATVELVKLDMEDK